MKTLPKAKSLVQLRYIYIYILIFIVVLLVHLQLPTNTDDDAYFIEKSLASLPQRYNNWSSRLLIEAVLFTILKAPLAWCVINTCLIVIIARTISYLFTKDTTRCKILALIGMALFSFTTMSTAGWISTTLNYLWPLAALLVAMIPIKHVLAGKQEKLFLYPVYMLCLLFACNQEQSCLLCLGLYLLFIAYFAIVKKRKTPFLYLQLCLTIASLVFILTCPGNSVRTISETAKWYPAYADFNLLHKIILGINGTFSLLINQNGAVYFALSLVLILYMYREKCKFRHAAPITLLPIIYNWFLHDWIRNIFPQLNNLYVIWQKYQSPISAQLITSPMSILLTLLIITTVGTVCVCLYDIFRNSREKSIFHPILFCAGFLSVAVMGMSPTIFASGTRTFIFFNFAMIAIIVSIICRQQNKHTKAAIIAVSVLAILQLMNTLAFIL